MIPQNILDTIKWDTHRPKQIGGQQCGIPNYGVKLTSEEFGFEISTNAFRSQIEERQFCLIVFELFLQQIKAI